MKHFLEITVFVILFIGDLAILQSCKKITLPEVTTENISGITQTTAVSGGNVKNNGGAEVTARGVCWGTTEMPTISPNKTSNGTGNGAFASSITGLTANTKYYVRAYATNSEGTSYGNEVKFTTLENPPVAAFIASQTIITAGQSVQFTDQSSNNPTGWSWDFGDGSTSTLKSPSHIYSAAGTYTVSLTATNSSGSDTETKADYIKVNPLIVTPVAAFTASPTTITAGQSVQFTDQSSNSPTGWNWDFGDGGTSTLKSPSHIYSTAGTYTVSLTATNSSGSDTETKIDYIKVNPVVLTPVAYFTASPTTITAGQSVQFTDQSSNTPTSWSWDFGDGGTSAMESPSHVYSTAGKYAVSLTATNSSGSDTETKLSYITVNLCPVALQVTHTAGSVAPVTKTVTYGIVETNLSGSDKCWITRNLGASNQASSSTDATEAAAGWYWQFNRKQGYKYDGTTRTPGTTWITFIDENSNWTPANDPCAILLGTGWRIPTSMEWSLVISNGGWNNWNDTYSSILKLHGTNCLYYNLGTYFYLTQYGFYWSTSQYQTNRGWSLYFSGVASNISSYEKAYGFSIRCLRD